MPWMVTDSAPSGTRGLRIQWREALARMRSRLMGTRPMLTMPSLTGSSPVVSTSSAISGTADSGVSPPTMPAA